MVLSLEDYVLTGGDLGRYQIFLAIVSSSTICMHTFCLTLEVDQVFELKFELRILELSFTGFH